MAAAEQKAFDGGNLNLIALNENLISPSARPPAPELISDEHNRSGGRKRGREGRRWGRGFVILNTINPPNFRPLGTFSPPPRHPSIDPPRPPDPPRRPPYFNGTLTKFACYVQQYRQYRPTLKSQNRSSLSSVTAVFFSALDSEYSKVTGADQSCSHGRLASQFACPSNWK